MTDQQLRTIAAVINRLEAWAESEKTMAENPANSYEDRFVHQNRSSNYTVMAVQLSSTLA